MCTEGSQDSTFDLVPKLQAEQLRKHGLIPSKDEIFLFSKTSGLIPATARPGSYSVSNSSSLLVGKAAGVRGHYSPPSNARVKTEWS